MQDDLVLTPPAIYCVKKRQLNYSLNQTLRVDRTSFSDSSRSKHRGKLISIKRSPLKNLLPRENTLNTEFSIRGRLLTPGRGRPKAYMSSETHYYSSKLSPKVLHLSFDKTDLVYGKVRYVSMALYRRKTPGIIKNKHTSINDENMPPKSTKHSPLTSPRMQELPKKAETPQNGRTRPKALTSQAKKTSKFTSKSKMLFSSKSSTPRSCKTLQKSCSFSSMVKQVNRPSRNSSLLYKNHLNNTFQAMKFLRSLRQPTVQEIEQKAICLPRRPGYGLKKTVIFDLDETLVHCEEDPSSCQTAINIRFPSGEEMVAGLNVRPYAREVLKAANRHYEVIVFTASHQCYADRALDFIDPTGELIHHRLYREHCVVIDGVHIKDLRILADRDVKDIVIVDNAAYSFGFQIDNGIPIISWYDNPRDRELFKLIGYLKVLAKAKDLRVLNRETFRLHTFYEDYLAEQIE